MTILLTCSAGGHLTEMKQLKPLYEKTNYAFVTFERADTLALAKKEKVYFIERPARNPLKTIHAFTQAWKIVSRVKPELIISTGADVTVPVCLAAKLRGIPIIFIESFCRVTSPSLTGKIISPLANTTIYQWFPLKKFYPNGIFAGSIFSFAEKEGGKGK